MFNESKIVLEYTRLKHLRKDFVRTILHLISSEQAFYSYQIEDITNTRQRDVARYLRYLKEAKLISGTEEAYHKIRFEIINKDYLEKYMGSSVFNLEKIEKDHLFVKALNNNRQRKILEYIIRKSPRTISELTGLMGLDKKNISQSMTKLKESAIVEQSRNGYYQPYYLSDLDQLRPYLSSETQSV